MQGETPFIPSMNTTTEHSEDTESTKPRRSRAFARRLLEAFFATWWGPVVAWWATALVHLAVCVVAPPLRIVGFILVVATGVALLLATLAAAVAWLRALGTHRWKRAAVQFVLGILSIPVFAVGAVVAAFAGRTFALAVAPQSVSRTVSIRDGDDAPPFSVRFTPSHPFLAEYDRCIVFPSGKRIGIWPDTGGGGPFAVYRLASGEYYLVCGLDFDWVRFDCRVNPENETVETMRGDSWIAIPDGTKAVTGGSSRSICVETGHGEKTVGGGVPVGDSLEGRTFLGLAHPDGRFESGGTDPLADTPDGLDAVEESIPGGDSFASKTFLGTILTNETFAPATHPATP